MTIGMSTLGLLHEALVRDSDRRQLGVAGSVTAGGAMLYVVSDELIPESHSHGFEHQTTGGFVLGFVVLLVLYKLV